jgi:hypothetical protein
MDAERGPAAPSLGELIAFAKRADWMQVVLNQGPPCFHVDPVHEPGRFCLRAKRWDGHGEGEWPMHRFVSLADLLLRVAAPVEPPPDALEAARTENYSLGGTDLARGVEPTPPTWQPMELQATCRCGRSIIWDQGTPQPATCLSCAPAPPQETT